MNIHSSLLTELRDKTYRDAYVASQIKIGLPYQARALRLTRSWTQGQLAERAGMAQPRIAEIEKPGERRLNLDTLLRLASAFDIGLEVRFVPFSELIDRSEAFDPDAFAVKPFAEELQEAEAPAFQPALGAIPWMHPSMQVSAGLSSHFTDWYQGFAYQSAMGLKSLTHAPAIAGWMLAGTESTVQIKTAVTPDLSVAVAAEGLRMTDTVTRAILSPASTGARAANSQLALAA